MKTYILSVPDEANDAAVKAALADLLAKQLVVLESDTTNLLGPLSEEEFAAELHAALRSPKLSADAAKAYLGL